MKILSIDVGGTTIKGNLYDEKGNAFNEYFELPTDIDYIKLTNNILNQIEKIVSKMKENYTDLSGVAISCSGVIDTKKGKVVYSGYTIPNFIGTEIKATIEQIYKIKCWVLNDVNCAALGEVWLGQKPSSGFNVYLTVGTGIGGAILQDKNTVNGIFGSAGEVGYQPLGESTWQELASTTALVNYYREYANLNNDIQANGKDVFLAYDKDEVAAKKAVKKFVSYLAEGMLPIIYLLNPNSIILSGGIFARGDVLIGLIKEELLKKIETPLFLPNEITIAILGNEANRLGALYYFLIKENILKP